MTSIFFFDFLILGAVVFAATKFVRRPKDESEHVFRMVWKNIFRSKYSHFFFFFFLMRGIIFFF